MSLHCRAGGCVCLPFLSSACGMDQSGGAQNKNPAEKQQCCAADAHQDELIAAAEQCCAVECCHHPGQRKADSL